MEYPAETPNTVTEMAQRKLASSRKEKFDLKVICSEVRFRLSDDKLSAVEGIWILEIHACDLGSRLTDLSDCWTQSHEWGNGKAEVDIFVR